jgi:hypothetical protein
MIVSISNLFWLFPPVRPIWNSWWFVILHFLLMNYGPVVVEKCHDFCIAPISVLNSFD